MDHARVLVQPEKAVGTEIGHPLSVDNNVATSPDLVHDQILEVNVGIAMLELLEDPDQCVLLQGSHQLIDGEVYGHGAPWVSGETTTDFLSIPGIHEGCAAPGLALQAATSRGAVPGIPASVCPLITGRWRPGWSDYRKNRKQSSSSWLGLVDEANVLIEPGSSSFRRGRTGHS